MATWYAGTHSTDSGNNTGWIFSAPSGGTLNVVLDNIAINLSGVISHNGSLSAQLNDVIISSTGNVIHNGLLSVQLDDATVSATGSVTHNGSLALTLGDVSFVAGGQDVHAGTIAIQLDDCVVALSGAVVHNGSLQLGLADVLIQMEGTDTPITSVLTKGGITKRTKNYKNQHDDVEKEVLKALNKVLGIEEPEERTIVEVDEKSAERDYTAQIRDLALKSQVEAIGKAIDEYESAMMQAELDDEEAILLLL
jgi:hypothetical protein